MLETTTTIELEYEVGEDTEVHRVRFTRKVKETQEPRKTCTGAFTRSIQEYVDSMRPREVKHVNARM